MSIHLPLVPLIKENQNWRHGHLTAENKGDNQLRCGGLAVSTFKIKLHDSHSHRMTRNPC
jgi:hypothetical protein